MTARSSTLVSGPYMDATITSENIFKSSSVDAIIFDCGPIILDVSLVLEELFNRSRIPTVCSMFTVVFFQMFYNKKRFRRSSVKYRTFSESLT